MILSFTLSRAGLCRIWTAAAVLALAPLFAQAGPLGYVTNFSGQFGVMDLGTGAFSPIGPGTNIPDGLGGKPGGPLFTVDGSNGHLLRIATNGTVTDVGDTGTGVQVAPNGISIMGSLTDGSLYALDFSNKLFSINSNTGGLTSLGTVALPTQESDYSGNMTTSFNGNATTLYYTLEISGGPNQTGPTLFAINPQTLAVTSIALTGLQGRLIGSGFIGNVFYGFDEFGDIVNINTGTGAATFVASYDSGSTPANPGPPFTGVFGVVATPEPGSLGLGTVGLGMGMIALRRKRII